MINPLARIMVDFKQMKQFIEDPLVIERGQGIRLWDVDGKEYIDGLAGVFVASVGHANPAIIETITDQLHKLTFAPPLASTNTAAIALAARLSEVTPPVQPCQVHQRWVRSHRDGDQDGTAIPQTDGASRQIPLYLGVWRVSWRDVGRAQRKRNGSAAHDL
jgi:hypothetical protein